MSKTSIAPVAAAHFRTLRDSRSGKLRASDLLMHVVLPVSTSIACFAVPGAESKASVLNDVMLVASAALLICSTAAFKTRLQLTSSRTAVSGDLATRIDELFCNMLWAAVSGFSAAASACLWNDFPGIIGDVMGAAAAGLAVSFALTCLMCFKRLSLAYNDITDEVEPS